MGDTFKLTTVITIAIAAAATIVFEFFPHLLIHIFGNEGENYIAFAVLCFRIYLCCIVFTCFQKNAGVFLQAVGKPVQSMIVSISRDLLFQLPAMVFMSSLWGITGLLWAAPVADLLAFIVTFIFIALQMRELNRKKSFE